MCSGEQGFTLVEVIVALMVLALVTVAVVQIYNSNFMAIILSGNRTEAVYKVQDSLEQEVAQGPDGRLDEDLDFLKIIFPGWETPVQIQGWTINKTSDDKVSATVFIPKPKITE